MFNVTSEDPTTGEEINMSDGGFETLPMQPEEFATAVNAISESSNGDVKGMFKYFFEGARGKTASAEDSATSSCTEGKAKKSTTRGKKKRSRSTKASSSSGRGASRGKKKRKAKRAEDDGDKAAEELQEASVPGAAHQDVGRRQARNRISAKRSRMRKESFMEALKRANRRLETENRIMRQYMQQATGQTVFVRSKAVDMSSTVDPAEISNINSEGVVLVRSLSSSEKSFILTDAQQPDNPITYASEQFYRLTGFSKDEVLGRNCRFLQGPLTNNRSVLRIREAVAKGEDCAVTLVNYKKSGKPFWNQLFVFPLRDEMGRVVNYIGVQSEVNTQTVISEENATEPSGGDSA